MGDLILPWFRSNPDVVGFLVATLIFIIAIILVSRRLIGFWITFLLLLFSLISGLTISNQNFLRSWLTEEKESKAAPISQSLELPQKESD